MSSPDALAPKVVRKAQHSWTEQIPGSSYTVLNFREHGGLTTITRFAAGTVGAWHSHPGGEEVYVIEGDLIIDGERLSAGDYIYSPPGSAHRVEAHSDVLLFVQMPQLPIYGEAGGNP